MSTRKEIEYKWKKKIEEILSDKITSNKIREELASYFLRGALEGKEIEVCFKSRKDKEKAEESFNSWIERVEEQIIWLHKEDYSRALIRALKLSLNFVSVDYDRKKKRDWSQMWTDAARGFLGEIALSKFFKEKFKVEFLLDNSRTSLEKALESDVIGLRLPNGKECRPAKKISIKTSKLQARWLDIPGDQINHSDIFFLVKIGISDKHFLSYLKEISFLKDKLFQEGIYINEINEEEANEIWNTIEKLDPIPAYIPGFFMKDKIQTPIQEVKAKAKKRGSKFEVEIIKALGLITAPDLKEYFLNNTDSVIIQMKKTDKKEKIVEEFINALCTDSVEYIISGIGRTISSNYKHFLASSGSLSYGVENFKKVLTELIGGKDE